MEQYPSNRLQYFPITLFASVMGLAGLSIVLQKMAHVLHFSAFWGIILLYLVSAWFVFFKVLAGIFMGFTILIIAFVLIKTIQAVSRGQLCVPEG